MDRRRLIKQLGGATLLSPFLFNACQSVDYSLQFLTQEQHRLLDDLSDIILPNTNRSPGAKAAKVGQFIDNYVFNCYDKAKQARFLEELNEINKHSINTAEKDFVSLSPANKNTCVQTMEASTLKSYLNCKQLILFGYFTSEVGATKALNYVAVPGKYQGDIAYQIGDGAWAL